MLSIKKATKAKLPSVFTKGNTQISNLYEIANNFFTNVGSIVLLTSFLNRMRVFLITVYL